SILSFPFLAHVHAGHTVGRHVGHAAGRDPRPDRPVPVRGVGGRTALPYRHPAGAHAGGRAAEGGPDDAAGQNAHHHAGQFPGRLHRGDVLSGCQHYLVHQHEADSSIAVPAHHVPVVRGDAHLLLARDAPAQPGAAGHLPVDATVPHQPHGYVRDLHPAHLHQECPAAHPGERSRHDHLAQSARAGWVEQSAEKQRRPGQLTADRRRWSGPQATPLTAVRAGGRGRADALLERSCPAVDGSCIRVVIGDCASTVNMKANSSKHTLHCKLTNVRIILLQTLEKILILSISKCVCVRVRVCKMEWEASNVILDLCFGLILFSRVRERHGSEEQ
uniref:Uncharacterized protein n=1 Tax=Anopheles quadriannulatus TaxID=34691 RepID=A0A182WSM1_ANOQN